MRPELAPIAFICALSLLLPLPWHWQARNVATLAIIAWLFVTNVILGVDAAIWGEHARIIYPVWCDITTKILIGANFALPAACLCISVHLERVASARVAQTTRSDQKKRNIFEATMCFGVPALFMILHYIVQGHRFDIIEEYGCRPTIYFSIPSILMIYVPPIGMALASLVFSALSLRQFIIRRLNFAIHLQASNSGLTTSRYIRLMLMSSFQMFWSLSFACFALAYTASTLKVRPWTSWADVHSDWGRVDQFLAAVQPPIAKIGYYILWWFTPASTIIFVAFFAFGRDAVDVYKKSFVWFLTHVLRLKRNDSSSSKKGFLSQTGPSAKFVGGSLPSYPGSPSATTSSAPSTPHKVKVPEPPTPTRYRVPRDDLSFYSTSSFSASDTPSPMATGTMSDLSETTLMPLSPPPMTAARHSPPSGFPFVPKKAAYRQVDEDPFISPAPASPRERLASAPSSPRSPRPVTYPSFDASHRDMAMQNV